MSPGAVAPRSGDATPPILAAEGLSMRYGKFLALSEVSVSFAPNTLTAIIGPNGAGKTTFFNVISGAYRPSFGRVIFEGRDITGSPQHAFARMGIAKSFQITSVFPQLSTHENVRVAVQMRSRRFDIFTPREALTGLTDKADQLLATVGLTDARRRPAADLAHGQQRCLEIALALACDPKLLLLDEPTAGMSPEETVAMMDLIVRLAGERTVILVEHKMKLVMGICQRVIVLHHGELLAEGSPAEVRANAEVKRVYLGQGV